MAVELENILLDPGTKFIINDAIRVRTLPPGTMGFVASYDWRTPTKNAARIDAVITRIGKAGKDRLDMAVFSVPIINLGHENMSNIGAYPMEGLLQVDPLPMPLDLTTIPAMDYLGWICSRVYRLVRVTHISSQFKAAFAEAAAKTPNFSALRNLREAYRYSSEKLIKDVAAPDQRNIYLSALRKVEASLTLALVNSDHLAASSINRTVQAIRGYSRKKVIKTKGIVKLAKEQGQILIDVKKRWAELNNVKAFL